MSIKLALIVACIASVSLHPALAQYTNRSSVTDGSGASSSNGAFTNLSAAGQPGGIATSSGGTYSHQAGFLNTFVLRPGLDTDGDGLANELDPDNDADGLADTIEINGSGFDPATPTLVNLADTDSDGQPDGREAAAGTDPTDPNALLELVAISNAPAGHGIAWLARGDSVRTYVVRSTVDPRQPYTTVLFSNTVTGGSAPWFAVTATVAHASTSNTQFYAVEVLP